MKEKEKVLHDFIMLIGNSWTVDRMTEKEKERLFNMLHDVRTEKALKGSYKQRWDILQAIFNAYLQGIGYTDFKWRENKKIPF